MWILTHKDNPTYFRLFLSLSGFQVDHESLISWCQPSPKKNPTSFIYLGIITTHEYLHRNNQFFPSQLWPKHSSCFANLRAWDSWPQDGWCLPHSFTLIILGVSHTIFRNRHPVPGADQHTGLKGDVFPQQPHLPYSSALGKVHWSEPERMGFLLIFYQPLGTAPSHS